MIRLVSKQLLLSCLLLSSTANAGALPKVDELSAQWWQYVYSFPSAESPPNDMTGERCAVGQQGPVWFLVGTFGGAANRTCTLPANKHLFFPVLNFLDVNTTNQTSAELRAEIGPCIDALDTLSVKLDGKSVATYAKKDKFRVKSPVYYSFVQSMENYSNP